jgi:hypothetical protein
MAYLSARDTTSIRPNVTLFTLIALGIATGLALPALASAMSSPPSRDNSRQNTTPISAHEAKPMATPSSPQRPETVRGTTSATITVNGENIELPVNGSVHREFSAGATNTTLNAKSQSSQTTTTSHNSTSISIQSSANQNSP